MEMVVIYRGKFKLGGTADVNIVRSILRFGIFQLSFELDQSLPCLCSSSTTPT